MQVMLAGFETGTRDLGAEPVVSYTNDFDPQGVLAVGRQIINQDVDGLVYVGYDASLLALSEEATEAGIPSAITHNPIAEADANGAIANYYPDAASYGAAVAAVIGDAIGGTGTVAITIGSFNPTENAAAEGFKTEMESSFPDVVVLDPVEEGFDPAQAISKAVSIIQGNPDLVAAYSTTGGGAVTWDAAVTQAGASLKIAGMDYSRVNLDLVRDGKITALVAQPIFEEHVLAAQAIAAHICGEEVVYDNPLPSDIITIDNVDEYYALLDENGL